MEYSQVDIIGLSSDPSAFINGHKLYWEMEENVSRFSPESR